MRPETTVSASVGVLLFDRVGLLFTGLSGRDRSDPVLDDSNFAFDGRPGRALAVPTLAFLSLPTVMVTGDVASVVMNLETSSNNCFN